MHAKEENNSLFEEQFYCLEWKRALWISELRHTQFAFFNNENVKHSIEPGKESTFSTRRHSTRREERRWMRHQPPLASLFPKLYSCLTNGELSQVGNGHWRGDSPLICSITFHLFSLVCCIGTSELFPSHVKWYVCGMVAWNTFNFAIHDPFSTKLQGNCL